jgi:hypothetical protein
VKAVIVAIKAEAVKTETDWGLTAAIIGSLASSGDSCKISTSQKKINSASYILKEQYYFYIFQTV